MCQIAKTSPLFQLKTSHVDTWKSVRFTCSTVSTDCSYYTFLRIGQVMFFVTQTCTYSRTKILIFNLDSIFNQDKCNGSLFVAYFNYLLVFDKQPLQKIYFALQWVREKTTSSQFLRNVHFKSFIIRNRSVEISQVSYQHKHLLEQVYSNCNY